jgi:DNA-binding NarL/FixJ family response regulator
MDKVKIFVVDDHPIFMKGLLTQLKEFSFINVVGSADNGRDFLEKVGNDLPDIVFMDIKMPEMNGIEATKAAMEKYPGLKIVALSMFGDEDYLQSMLDAGAKGFLLKNIEKGDLEKAIRSVMEGRNYFSEELLSILTNKFVNKPKPADGKTEEPIKFSQREEEVLKLICQGFTNQEIGSMLFISQRTVDGHRANLLSKVGAKNTVGLVTYAIKNKLVSI